jgi:hypothetical protein
MTLGHRRVFYVLEESRLHRMDETKHMIVCGVAWYKSAFGLYKRYDVGSWFGPAFRGEGTSVRLVMEEE